MLEDELYLWFLGTIAGLLVVNIYLYYLTKNGK